MTDIDEIEARVDRLTELFKQYLEATSAMQYLKTKPDSMQCIRTLYGSEVA